MKKNGNADSTIETATTRLKRLARNTNIDDPEQVKTYLATTTMKNSSKQTVARIYTGYLKFLNKTWNEPKYTAQTTLPFIPTEAELDSLITSGLPKTSALLQLLKETGARIGEIDSLKWTHIDTQRKTIYITGEKGSNSRILPISNTLINMLNNIPKTNNNIFQTRKHGLRTTFEYLRTRTAKKLNNPRLNNIHFHTFRHWKATMEYHKTKDIIHVKTMLGHKSIDNTMLYINLEQALFLTANDEWTSRTAKTPQETLQLIDTGFEYVTQDQDGLKYFRKRK